MIRARRRREAIRARRLALGWSQAKLGRLAGVGAATVSEIERGVASPRLAAWAAIERVLDAAGTVAPS